MKKSTHTFEYRLLLERLADIRKKAGLSQRRLAALLRVPHSWVAKVESGERRLDLIEFGWFCSACGVSPADEASRLFRNQLTSRASANRRGGRR